MADPQHKSYLDEPCERCGSPKKISKTWKETIETISGTSVVEVSQTICTNKVCQQLFDATRAEEILKINERKLAKEEQDRNRRNNIAQAIVERKNAKMDLRLK